MLELPRGYRFEGYTIERTLGSGGFGITYLARDQRLKRAVAIKEFLVRGLVAGRHPRSFAPVLRSGEDRAQFEAWLARFLREAQLAASLNHPNIVRIHRVIAAHRTAYIAMDYLGDTSLRARLAAGPLAEPALRALLPGLFDALAFLHARALYHLDIKPSNVMLSEGGRPVLIDFGAAWQRHGSRAGPTLRPVSSGFAAPEQYSDVLPVGPWTDIYGLAAMLYCAMTGRDPEPAISRQQRTMRGDADPLEPLDAAATANRYPAPLRAAVMDGLALHEQQRPQSVAAWAARFGIALPDAPAAGLGDSGRPSSGRADAAATLVPDAARPRDPAATLNLPGPEDRRGPGSPRGLDPVTSPTWLSALWAGRLARRFGRWIGPGLWLVVLALVRGAGALVGVFFAGFAYPFRQALRISRRQKAPPPLPPRPSPAAVATPPTRPRRRSAGATALRVAGAAALIGGLAAAAVYLPAPTRTPNPAAATAPPALDRQAALRLCDRLAAHPDDPTRPRDVAGVWLADMNQAHAQRAIEACEAAARLAPGEARARFNLGRAYHIASSLWPRSRDEHLRRARQDYDAAARLGSAAAAGNLGQMRYLGHGGSRDLAGALDGLRRAAAARFPDAYFTLGHASVNGTGTGPSQADAYFWYTLAQRASTFPRLREDAGAALRKLDLSDDERAAADRRIEAWLARR